MSFDINQPVFDSKGTYLEEQALRYEQALMDQFTASRSVTSDHPKRNRTGLGTGDAPLCHHLCWRDAPDNGCQRSGRSRLEAGLGFVQKSIRGVSYGFSRSLRGTHFARPATRPG